MIALQDKSIKVADQVAFLLNQNNQLERKYTGRDVLNSTDHYYPLSLDGVVVASVAIKKLNNLLSEIRHLVVHPDARRNGLGVEMLKLAIKNVKTPLMCATIRQGNLASMKVFVAQGFRRLSKIAFNDHSIYYYFRET